MAIKKSEMEKIRIRNLPKEIQDSIVSTILKLFNLSMDDKLKKLYDCLLVEAKEYVNLEDYNIVLY